MGSSTQKGELSYNLAISKRGLIFTKNKMLRVDVFPAPNYESENYTRRTERSAENLYLVQITESAPDLDCGPFARVSTLPIELMPGEDLRARSISVVDSLYKRWLREEILT